VTLYGPEPRVRRSSESRLRRARHHQYWSWADERYGPEPRRREARPTPTSGAGVTLYFLLRRWTRVRLSSLRCFFFAIRLRRFLITEPIAA
jgi:hypothetical protein